MNANCFTSLSRLSSVCCVGTMKNMLSENIRMSRYFSGSGAYCNKTSNNSNKAEKVNVKDTIISFKDLRKEVLEELRNKEVAGVKWKRFTGLNKLLKGHRRGELTVLTGPTGSGKTTFLSESSLDLCEQGVKTLWGNFELKSVRLMKQMLNQFARKSLDKNLELFDKYADEFEKLPMYFMKFHGSQNFETVLQTMKYAVKEFNVEHIIIDNLQFMIGNRASTLDRFVYQDSIVGLCRSFATDTNTHVTIVVHPRKELTEELSINSIFGGGKVTQEADNILILQFTRSLNKKYLQVAKNRYDGDLGSFLLFYDHERHGFGYIPSEDGKKKKTVDASIYNAQEDSPKLRT